MGVGAWALARVRDHADPIRPGAEAKEPLVFDRDLVIANVLRLRIRRDGSLVTITRPVRRPGANFADVSSPGAYAFHLYDGFFT